MPMPPPGRKLRKREVVFAVAMGALAATGAAVVLEEGDGGTMPIAVTAAPQTYDLADVDAISIEGPQNVVITRGDTAALRSEGPPEALARYETVVEDGRLVIRPRAQFQGGFGWPRRSAVTFYVTLPRLNALSQDGRGDIRVDRIEGESFIGTITGSGELSIAAMQVGEADFIIQGSGELSVAGSARESRVSIAGSGDVHANGLQSERAEVSIAGSGDVALTVDDEAEIRIMGSGDVDIAGAATCSVTRMGSGDVRCNGNEVE
jgi:hypothetical protein